MERLLEAVLGSFLRDYVHSSKETESGAFKASWTARGISLHDINLNINKINLPRVNLRKATAKSLEVKIPWASLATQAIEVHIVGVELTADGDVTVSKSVEAPLAKPWDNWPDPSDCRNSSSSGDSGGGWVGESIQSRLLRTALQISVFVDGVSIFVHDGPDSFTCQVGSFSLTNLVLDELLDFVKNPRCWFNKGLCLRSADIVWNKSGTVVARLSVDSIQISALLPSRLFISTDKHEDQFLIPLGVEVSTIDLDLFDGFFEAFRKKIQAAGKENGNIVNDSDRNYFQSFSSFMNYNGIAWALDWGLTILTIKVNVHLGDLHQDGFALPDKNLLTILFQNIIHRCSLEGRIIEMLFALGSTSMRFQDRKRDKAYSIFSAIPFHDLETEHAITATIRSDPFEETILKLNCTKIDVNIPWECEAYGIHIMNTLRDEFPASSRESQDERPSVARKLFSEVAVEIHDLDIGISNQDDRLSLVLKNVHLSRDMSGSVNAAAYLIFAHLSSSSDRGTATEKISNSVHFCFEVTSDGWKYSWDPLRVCVKTGSALARLTSCLTGNQNCHKFPSLPVSIKIEIGSDGFTSNAWGNDDQMSVSSTMDLTLGIDDQALSFHSSFDIEKADNVMSIFLGASEIDLVKCSSDHQRSILRIFLSDVILRHSKTSKSCLLGCIAIDALAISSDFSSMFLIFEYFSLHYSQNSPSSGKESTGNHNQHENFRVETFSLTLRSSSQKDALCIWLSDASFVKELDIEHFHIQDGGIHLKRGHDVIECLSFARSNPLSPMTKATMKSSNPGEIDRDLEVLDLEIKVYPCMPIFLGEVIAMKNCLQNTWKNITLSMNPSKIRKSHCSIQSSMMVRIRSLDVSLQDESSSAEIQLGVHLREVCVHYIQKSLISKRFWLDSILNTENDAKLLTWIESGSVSTSGNSGHATPLVLPFSLFLSAYTWPIGNRKFISASTSHVVFQVDVNSLKDISSMLRSYSSSSKIHDNEYCPDNEVLKMFHSDDDLRSRPSLLSRTCDRKIFDAEVSVEIVVHDISAYSFSWTYRHPRSVNRLHFKELAIMPAFIGSCFKLSCIGPLQDKEVVIAAFTVDSTDFMLRLKTVQPSCGWCLSWDKKMEEDDLILLLKSISIFSSDADLRHSPLNCSVSFSFIAHKITATFLAISWPFGECLGGHVGVNVLSEFSWLEPNISMTSYHQLIEISGSGKLFVDYTDPFDFTPLRLMDCPDLTASYTFMLQDRESSSQDNGESLTCGATETVETHTLCLDTNSRINLITSRYVLYDLRHLWKLASEEFPFYPLKIRNNSSSQVSIKQLGCSEEIRLGRNSDKWYPLRHNKPKFLQFSCQSQSKTTWSRGVYILKEEQCLRINIPPTVVLSVKIVRTHSDGVIVTLNDGLHLKNSTTKLTFVCLNGQELRLDPGQKCSVPSTECELMIKLSNGWSNRFCLDSESKIVEAENPTETLDIDTFPTPPVLINSGRCASDCVYHICYPVTLKNSLDQNLAISGRADTAETRILLKESSMDLILRESGGKVCTLSREDRQAREDFIGLFCPGYATQEGGDSRNQISHLTQSEILAPAPGQWTRLSLPPEYVERDGKTPTNVILQSCITPYNTLELKFSNELYLCNTTCRTVKFLMDSGEVLVLPSQTSGINAPMANYLRVAISPSQDSGDVWYTTSTIDVTMSSQMIIDATDQDIQQSVKLFIDIDIASQCPSKIVLKPFYYITNLTSFVLSHGVEKVSETETKPLLYPLDLRAQTIKIKQMKHKKDGKMILVGYLMLPLLEKDRLDGNTEGLTCKTVRKPDMVHFIVMSDSTELMVRNKLDVQLCIDVLSRDMEMLRSYHLEQDSQKTLHLGHSDASIQVRVNESSFTVDAVTKIAVGEVVRYPHFLIRRTNLHSIEIRHVGRSYKQKISRYSFRCSRFSILYHSRPQNSEEDRILELEMHGVSVRLQTNAALETYSTDFRIDNYFMYLEAFSRRSNIISGESPAATLNCQGFLTDIHKHHKIDAIEGSLGTLFVAIDDATIEALVDVWGDFRVDEVHSSLTDDTFVDLQEMRNTPVCIQKFMLKPINIFLDSRLSRSAWLPFAINTSRAPISVAAISYEGERSAYEVVRLLREDVGDSLFRSAPYLLGSLQLLFDPVGMFRSLRRGLSGIVNLPVEGIRKKSLTSFLSGVGHGSANFFKEISGWSYSTAIGFSKSIADILRKNPSITERQSRKGQEFIEEPDVRMSRPLVYGVQNLVNLSSKLGTVLWYRDILQAKVSLKTDPKFSIKIVSPVLLIHDQGLVVFAHWGTTASFQILSTCDSQICAVKGTQEIIIESGHCTTFGGHESQQQSRESIIRLCIAPDDFETVLLIFKEVWEGHTSST